MTTIEDKEIIQDVLKEVNNEPSEETIKRNKDALDLLNKLIKE